MKYVVLATALGSFAFAAEPPKGKPLPADQTLAILKAQDGLTKAQTALQAAAQKTPEFAQFTKAQKAFQDAVQAAEKACGGVINKAPGEEFNIVCTPKPEAPPAAKK